MARIAARAFPVAARSPLPLTFSPRVAAALWWRLPGDPASSSAPAASFLPPGISGVPVGRSFHVSCGYLRSIVPFGGFFANLRGFRKVRRKQAASKKEATKDKQLQLDVKIGIEEEMPKDPEVLVGISYSHPVNLVIFSALIFLQNIVEMLKLNVPMAMKIAFDGLKDSEYKTRDTSIGDVGKFEKVELSILLCNDDFIRRLNKDWRGEDQATDVLSISQHIAGLDLPVVKQCFLMLGDIVISVETAARQAEERGHALLDEIRILMVRYLFSYLINHDPYFLLNS
ncbi:hypothetical protein BHM03_00000565 [Ensete ventricosum]|nr:hypothetical protein BHM03_00000565 [Ensete ventricosum]